MVNYWNPTCSEEVLQLYRDHMQAGICMGGTDYMLSVGKPSEMIFLGKVNDWQNIKEDAEGVLHIGAAVRYCDLVSHEKIPKLLQKAASNVGSPAIRNRGTLIGNICNAFPAGDCLPVLYLLNAQVVVASVDIDNTYQERIIPIENFITGVKQNVLCPPEMVVGINIPVSQFDIIYYEAVVPRKSQAINKLSVVGGANIKGGNITDLRVAFGAVGKTVVRNRAAEKKALELLIAADNQEKQLFSINKIINSYTELIVPIDDNRSTAVYRKTVYLNLLEDFLKLMLD